jgi:outer membrane protein
MPNGILRAARRDTQTAPGRCDTGAKMRRPTQHCLALIILDLSGGPLLTNTAIASEPQIQAADTPEHFHAVLGAGAYTIPVYPGSSGIEVRPVPAADVTWNRLFLRSGEGAGVYLWHQRAWDIGVSVDADLLHRYEADDTRLHGLGNVSKTARANVLVTRRCPWMEATLKVSADIGGAGHGNVVDLEVARFHTLTPRLNVRTGIGTTWTNASYMRTFFGVDARQSARSGLPSFSPEGGISSARLFFSARYEIRAHWLLGGQVYATRLFGDAADSPITQKRTAAGGGVFLVYRLR